MIRFFALLFLAVSLHAAGPVRVAFDAQVVTWNNRCIATNYYMVQVSPPLTSNRTLNTTQALIASSVWMGGVRAIGLYPGNILRANLFCGGSYGGTNGAGDDPYPDFAAPTVPLINDAGSPNDSAGANRNYWKYQETGTSGGLGCVSISNPVFFDTGVMPTNVASWQNDVHVCIYMTSGGAELSVPMGASDVTAANTMQLSPGYTGFGHYVTLWNLVGYPAVADTVCTGFYVGTRVSSATTGLKIYRNGVLTATSTSVGGDPASLARTIWVFGINNVGSLSYQTAHLMGGYALGRGLTAAQVTAYYNAWQQFETLLGRQK